MKAGLYPHTVDISIKYKKNIPKQIIGNLRVQYEYSKWARVDKPKLRALKNHHKDDRCFILGNGPSLTKLDLTLLKNEITFGVNSIFLLFDNMKFKPTYYVVVDNLVCEDRMEIINSLGGMTKLFPLDRANSLRRDANTIYFLTRFRKDLSPEFSTDVVKGLFGGFTVTFTNLQLAYYMGFKEVHLIGLDHNYRYPKHYKMDKVENRPGEITTLEEEPNHFHPEYFGKGLRWHEPEIDKMENGYKLAKQLFEDDNREILNASIGGKLELFRRVDYESLF